MAELLDPDLAETLAIVVALVVSGFTTYLFVPPIMRKMRERGIVGRDWNKKDKKEIPELGGIAVLFGFPIGISIAVGLMKLLVSFDATLVLATIGVLYIGGMIGIIDDISNIAQRVKGIILAFAALPLLLARFHEKVIEFPFNIEWNLSADPISLVYWLIIVPIAITGAANAMNMSAGYNGLESGQITVISFFLLVTALITEKNLSSILIFSALLGAAVGLNHFNGFPAVVFVGDVGTLSMGAIIGAGVIIGNLEFTGLIAIGPAFYEAIATGYYSFVKKIDRKSACTRPSIDEEGRLHPPEGAEKYTLAFWILSKKPMTEPNLVRTILSIYVLFGLLALVLTLL